MKGVTQNHALQGPKPGTVADKVISALYARRETLSKADMTQLRGLIGVAPDTLDEAIQRAVRFGWIERTYKYTYALTAEMRDLLDQRNAHVEPKYVGEIVPAPYRPGMFRPAYKPPVHPRADEIRRMSFVTCSGVPSNVLV